MHASYFQFNSIAMGQISVQWTGTFEVVYCVQLKMKGINNLFDMTPFNYRLEKIRVSKVPPSLFFSKICNILWQILSFLVTWNSLREKDQTVQAKIANLMTNLMTLSNGAIHHFNSFCFSNRHLFFSPRRCVMLSKGS